MNPENQIVLSLYDYSGNILEPWAEVGYECVAVDIKHAGEERVESVGEGSIEYVAADVTDWLPPRREYAFVSVFPPCDNLAVSGARWFKEKGLESLSGSIDMVMVGREIAKWAEPEHGWFLENPVSTLSSYWRDPDHMFHPYEYDPLTDEDEMYTKKTCLWSGEGFTMPEPCNVDEDDADDRIHKMPPSEDRAEKRATTPTGFSRAVFDANCPESDGRQG